MPVDPCLPVPLGGYAPPAPPHVHRIHRIIGRIRHHGRGHHTGYKTGMAPLDGCGRVPAGLPGALPGGKGAAPAAFLPKIIPAAAGGAAVVGGSGIVGGFGGGGTIPVGGGGGGNPGGSTGGGGGSCTGANCTPTPVPEPASFVLLGMALLLVALLRPRGTPARQVA